MNKKHIAHSFGKASQTYETQAPVQKWTADYLNDYIAGLEVDEPQDCLEIGCGTGFLTRKMLNQFTNSRWLVTDLSPDMVVRCRETVQVQADFRVMDGEHPNTDKRFDLIVSTLAFQWFHDLPSALERLINLLKPGGRLVFSTLGKHSFQEWRENLQRLNMSVGLHDYPALEDLQQLALPNCRLHFEKQVRVQPYENGLDFLKALKTIGAQAPQSGYRPMTGGQMRKVINALEKSGDCSMTYEILIGDIQKKDRS